MQQAVLEPPALHLDALGEDEGALELAPGNAAVQIDALGVVGLLAADHQLVVLDRDRQVAHRKAGDREGNAQLVVAELLDVVGRIPVARELVDPDIGLLLQADDLDHLVGRARIRVIASVHVDRLADREERVDAG